jgi:PAS domain S-box-containing protein
MANRKQTPGAMSEGGMQGPVRSSNMTDTFYPPFKLFIITITTILLSEIASFLVVDQVRVPFDILDALIDAGLTTLCVFPIVYIVVFRQMDKQLKVLRQLERSLRQSEADYRGIIEDQTELICQFDRDGRISFVNGEFCRFFNQPTHQLHGEDFFGLFRPEDASRLKGVIASLNTRQPIGNGEYEMKISDGSLRWSSWTFHAIYRGEDDLVHYQSVGRDTTEHKQILQELQESRTKLEQKVQQRTSEIALVNRELRAEIATRKAAEVALQASETHLRQLVGQIPAILWTMDRDLTLTSLLGSRLTEFKPQMENLLSSDLQQRMATGDLSKPEVQAHASALQGLRADFELQLSEHDFQCTVEPFRDPDGQIIGCLGIALDITTRKKNEATILQQHAALEAAADGIIITDEKGVIQWANPAMTTITGYPVAELTQRTPAIFQSGQHSQSYYANLWSTILSGKVWRGETINRRKDGSFYPEDQTITPVLDADGRIRNLIAIKNDISDRKQAEAEITRRNWELQALRDASISLTQSLNTDIVIQTVLDLVERLVPEADRITLLNLEDGCLQVAGTRGTDSIAPVPHSRVIHPDPHAHLQSIVDSLHYYLIEDTRLDPVWKPALGGMATRTWLGVPIHSGGKLLGICCLESEKPCCFSRQHISLTEALFGHAAVAIQNARLYREIRDSREHLQALSRRLVEVQESERRYIARELHDDASQALVGLVFALEGLKNSAGDPKAVTVGVGEIEALISDILDNLHRLAINLRPVALDHLGLVPAIRQYLDSLREKSPLSLKITVPDLTQRLSPEMETTIYRVIQEALANVVLHASASNAEVNIDLSDGYLIAWIVDDGIGFNLDEALARECLGLFGMRERVEMLGGKLMIDSSPGAGTRISLEVPCGISNSDRG